MADAAKSGFGDIRCHQMSPDVRILTDNQAVILLFKSGYWNKIWSEKTSFCVNVAWQSEFMRILCSSEQSKLCPCPTKVFCRTRTNLPAPRAGESAPKSRILEEKVQTKNHDPDSRKKSAVLANFAWLNSQRINSAKDEKAKMADVGWLCHPSNEIVFCAESDISQPYKLSLFFIKFMVKIAP